MTSHPQYPEYSLSDNKQLLDTSFIHRFLSQEAYWSKGKTEASVQQSIDHSICFGLYHEGQQAGFARVISDQTDFAYLLDVFIDYPHRNKGLSKWLLQHILSDDRFATCKFMLATTDAHGLYNQLGFEPVVFHEKFMERKKQVPVVRESQ
jgi:GNAT superfamily N-acetyltransferase